MQNVFVNLVICESNSIIKFRRYISKQVKMKIKYVKYIEGYEKID